MPNGEARLRWGRVRGGRPWRIQCDDRDEQILVTFTSKGRVALVGRRPSALTRLWSA
jgi:hypothetical protein